MFVNSQSNRKKFNLSLLQSFEKVRRIVAVTFFFTKSLKPAALHVTRGKSRKIKRAQGK